MKRLDFELKIGTPEGRKVPISVIGSPAGEGRTEMTFPYDSLALENRLQALQLALLSAGPGRRRLVPQHEQSVQTFGSELFEALFTDDIRSLFDRSRQEAIRQGADLRIQLRFESADMASLPWEFLYDARRAEYLSLSTTTPIVRYVELADPQEPLSVTPPLRLLAMTASPSDLPALDVEQEQQRMQAALGQLGGQFELHWVEGQTWRDLQAALRKGPWHAFHFVGHGGFDTNLGEGIIALTADGGGTHRLGATDLGRLLGDHHPLRLAVLNSCEGARADKLDVFSSTAAVLVRRGTPAVVAMQYEITDIAAVELSRAFYGALAAGLPVDESLGEARKSVALAVPGTLEWGTPVLYLRAADSRIFDIDPTAAPPVPSPPVPPTPDVSPPPPPASPPAPVAEPEVDRPLAGLAATAGSGTGAGITTGTGVTTGTGDGDTRTGTGDGGSPPSNRRKFILAGGAAALVLLLVLLLIPKGGDKEPTGTGTFSAALEGDARFMSHTVEVPENSILLLEVSPSDGFDPDLAVSTDAATGRELARYLSGAGFDRSRFRGALNDYGYNAEGKAIVGRADEYGAGEPERLLVTAPRGGMFEVVVAAAGDTSGAFDLDVIHVHFQADEDGATYIDDLMDAGRVNQFLSENALGELEAWASIQLGFEPEVEPVSVHVSVQGTERWTDTELDLTLGDQVSIRASGRIFDDLGGKPDQSFEPDGAPDPEGIHSGDPYRPFNHAVLVGRIGEDGKVFTIGSSLDGTAEQEGRLFLGINDSHLADNGGVYEVVIEVLP